MCDARSNSHLGNLREVMNTTCEALMAASPSQVVSASRTASASLTLADTNVERKPGLEVESSCPSGDLNQLPALTRVGKANDSKPPTLQHHHHSSHDLLLERFNDEAPSNSSDEVIKKGDQDEVDCVQSPIVSEEETPGVAAAAAVQRAADSQDPDPAPKWIRVGERVCFSTVVSAVLIPSAEDISATSKRELWWQPEDFFEFRMNHARRQAAGKSANDDDDEEDNTVRTPVVTATATPTVSAATRSSGPEEGSTTVTTTTAYGKGSSNATTTVEGVLIVAATPACAPTVVASRSSSFRAGVVDGDGRDGGGNSRAGEDIKRNSRPPYPVSKERDGKWAPRGEKVNKNARTDYQHAPRRFIDNRGRGAAASTNHGGQKRHGLGNRLPPTSNSAGRHGRRAIGHNHFPSYRNHVAQHSFEPSQLYGTRHGTVTASNYYAPPPNLGRHPLYSTGANMAVPEPFLMSRYSQQQPMHDAMGVMPPASVHPGIMVVRAQDTKPQFSMWRSPVFAPIIMQCARENVVM